MKRNGKERKGKADDDDGNSLPLVFFFSLFRGSTPTHLETDVRP